MWFFHTVEAESVHLELYRDLVSSSEFQKLQSKGPLAEVRNCFLSFKARKKCPHYEKIHLKCLHMWRLMLFAVTKQHSRPSLWGHFSLPLFLPDNRPYAFSETSWAKQLNVLYGFHMFELLKLKDFWVQMQALQSRLARSTLGAGGRASRGPSAILIEHSFPRASDQFIWTDG